LRLHHHSLLGTLKLRNGAAMEDVYDWIGSIAIRPICDG
jgi:hypothetical protein